jgi:hypothetical protein
MVSAVGVGCVAKRERKRKDVKRLRDVDAFRGFEPWMFPVNLVEETRAFREPYYGRSLSDCEARDLLANACNICFLIIAANKHSDRDTDQPVLPATSHPRLIMGPFVIILRASAFQMAAGSNNLSKKVERPVGIRIFSKKAKWFQVFTGILPDRSLREGSSNFAIEALKYQRKAANL